MTSQDSVANSWTLDSRLLDSQSGTNEARMSMKTKDRCGKFGDEAGMSMKTKIVSHKMPEYY